MIKVNMPPYIEKYIQDARHERKNCVSSLMYGYYSGIIDILYELGEDKEYVRK